MSALPPPTLTGVLLSLLAPLALARAAAAAGPFPVKDGVNCRAGPTTGDAVVASYAAGTQITVECATHGEAVNGHDVWDRTGDGCFVSDYYVETGTSALVAPECGGGGGGEPGGSGSGGCANVNDAGVALIKSFEGFQPSPYRDPVGLWTVGYGHLCAGGGADSSCGDTGFAYPLTEAAATELLKKDLPAYVACMPKHLGAGATLDKNQWAALTSFTYNLGCGVLPDFAGRLNAGEDANAVISQEFPKYVNAGGQQLAGLVRRRNEEVALAQTPGSTEAWPNCAA